MAQKFTSLDEAADQLGISKDRLSELRDANVVRGYRDGASWKFRSEDIERLATEGIPDVDPGASDLSLSLDDDSPPAASSELDLEPPRPAADNEEDIGLADESSAGRPGSASSPASDLSLEDVDEPTVAGLDDDDSDDALALDDDESIDMAKDSILLSEKELGGPVGRPPSTIIGKGELDLDADLDLSPIDSGSHPKSNDPKATSGSGSDLTAADDDLAIDLPSPSGEFAGLEELDVDLEAESSRILSPEDVTKAKSAAKAASSKLAGLSDLELAPTPSDPGIAASDIRLDESPSGSNIAGLSALELDDDEDDQVLGEGSDVTLSGESSGINIISPSDSGLALDEVPLDLSGSAPMGSSLDLGEGDGGLSFGSGVSGIGSGVSGIEAKGVDEFQLTPLGEEEADEEKDSSQVIAIDDLTEESSAMPVGLGGGEEGMLVGDYDAGLTPSTMAMGATAATETPFSLWNVLGLASCLLLLGLSGMMTYDLLRNMWSWDGVTSLNSSLMDGLLSLFQ
jgi:excisionase family DNA binding protein